MELAKVDRFTYERLIVNGTGVLERGSRCACGTWAGTGVLPVLAPAPTRTPAERGSTVVAIDSLL